MSKQNNSKVDRRKFLSTSVTGLAGATAVISALPAESDAKPETSTWLDRTSIEIIQYAVEWNPETKKGRVAIGMPQRMLT